MRLLETRMNEHSEDGKKADREKAAEAVSADAGEDDASTSREGKDDHLKEDQKPTTK
jgi:hypothetical protein